LAISTVLSGHVLAYVAFLVGHIAPAGSGHAAQVAAEIAATTLGLLLPTIWMGALFSHLLGSFTPSGVGRAYALNTLGAAIAPFIFGLVLIPSFGPTVAFHSVTALYLALFALDSLVGRRPERSGLAVLAACVVLMFTAPSLVLIRFPDRVVGSSLLPRRSVRTASSRSPSQWTATMRRACACCR
jgi:hypothetical protein